MRVFKTEQVDAKKTIEGALSNVQLGAETTFGNMTIFPLLDGDNGSADYLTLDDAVARGLVQITEVSVQGSVPDLKLNNESDEPVLLLDGEELIGAKQNRILNLTILAPANRTIVIPVSCVEAGRWSPRSAQFTTSSQAHFARGRAKKMAQVSDSLRASGERRSDQQAVWEEIGAKAACLKVQSPTSAMLDIYETYTKRIDEYAGAFTAVDRQVGAAICHQRRSHRVRSLRLPSDLEEATAEARAELCSGCHREHSGKVGLSPFGRSRARTPSVSYQGRGKDLPRRRRGHGCALHGAQCYGRRPGGERPSRPSKRVPPAVSKAAVWLTCSAIAWPG